MLHPVRQWTFIDTGRHRSTAALACTRTNEQVTWTGANLEAWSLDLSFLARLSQSSGKPPGRFGRNSATAARADASMCAHWRAPPSNDRLASDKQATRRPDS